VLSVSLGIRSKRIHHRLRYTDMLGKNSMFRTQKPRKFTYVPIYWDPEKEEKEQKQRWRETGEEESSIRFNEEFQSKMNRKTNNTRILIIVILLLILFIFFW